MFTWLVIRSEVQVGTIILRIYYRVILTTRPIVSQVESCEIAVAGMVSLRLLGVVQEARPQAFSLISQPHFKFTSLLINRRIFLKVTSAR